MTLFKFLISKAFLKHFAYAFSGIIVLLVLTFLILKVYTHHGKYLSVPDFTGLTMEEVQTKAKKSKLRIEVTDSIFNNNKPRGTVIEQNPVSGFQVKKNRRIFLVMNALNPEKVKMPDIVGVSHVIGTVLVVLFLAVEQCPQHSAVASVHGYDVIVVMNVLCTPGGTEPVHAVHRPVFRPDVKRLGRLLC